MSEVETKNKENLAWVNWAKVICLFLVYFYHTQSRSGYTIGRLLDILDPFVVNTFFVISGYLMFKKQLRPSVSGKSRKEWFNHGGRVFLENLLFKLIIPTLIFATLLYVPKVLIKGGDFNMIQFFIQTIGGGGFWFTSSLAVAEFLLFLLLFVRLLNPFKFFVFSLIISIIAHYIHSVCPINFPWYYQTGMCATLFLSFGGILYCMEQKQLKCMANKYSEMVWIVAIVVYLLVILKVTPPASLKSVEISVLGVLMALLSILIILHYSKKLPHNYYIDRIGRHTLGLYFLSGALPETLSGIYRHIDSLNGWIVFLIAILSFVIGIFINEVIVRYAPLLFDLRKAKI